MPIWKYLLILITLTLAISCTKKSKYYYPDGKLEIECNQDKTIKCKEYFENGELKAEIDWLNGKKDGISRYYYPNGKIEQEIHWKAGKKNGSEIFYNKNGKIDIEGKYLMGKPVGWFKEYDKDGLLNAKYEYVFASKAKDGKTVNQHIFYDKAGNIIPEESHYLVFSNVPDSINIGKEYNLQIKLVTPHYKSKMRLVKVCGEEGFTASDPTKYEFIEAKNFEVSYKFTPNKHGVFNLCGAIHDYKISGNPEDSVREAVFRTILFEKKFWVN